MKKSYKYTLLALCALPLTACGEGYVPELTNTFFPYGNQRTAGSGVAYVIAKMMPEKELKLVPVEEPPKPKVITPEPEPKMEIPPPTVDEIPDLNPTFRESQKK